MIRYVALLVFLVAGIASAQNPPPDTARGWTIVPESYRLERGQLSRAGESGPWYFSPKPIPLNVLELKTGGTILRPDGPSAGPKVATPDTARFGPFNPDASRWRILAPGERWPPNDAAHPDSLYEWVDTSPRAMPLPPAEMGHWQRRYVPPAPPDTLAIHLFETWGPIPERFRDDCALHNGTGWISAVVPNYETMTPREKRLKDSGDARLRLVVFTDGTARIERHDGASWGALRLR